MPVLLCMCRICAFGNRRPSHWANGAYALPAGSGARDGLTWSQRLASCNRRQPCKNVANGHATEPEIERHVMNSDPVKCVQQTPEMVNAHSVSQMYRLRWRIGALGKVKIKRLDHRLDRCAGRGQAVPLGNDPFLLCRRPRIGDPSIRVIRQPVERLAAVAGSQEGKTAMQRFRDKISTPNRTVLPAFIGETSAKH